MDRGTRRHHAERIKARHKRRLFVIIGPWMFEEDKRAWNRSKIWWPWHKLTMRSYPKAWDVEMHTRPARARARHALKLVLRGVPDELLDFPDYRKPHIYYW